MKNKFITLAIALTIFASSVLFTQAAETKPATPKAKTTKHVKHHTGGKKKTKQTMKNDAKPQKTETSK